jgi:hypothetical protein
VKTPKPVVAALAAVPLAFGAGLGIATLAGGGDGAASAERPPAEVGGPGPTIDLLGRAAAIPPLARKPEAPSAPPVTGEESPPATPPPPSSPPATVVPPGDGGGSTPPPPEPPPPEPPPPDPPIDE